MKISCIGLVAWSLASASGLQAQTFTVTPNDTMWVVVPPSGISIFDIYQENITSAAIDFVWSPVFSDIPAGWDYSMCDLGHCYIGLPATGAMDPVQPGEQGFLGLNLNPQNISGSGMVQLLVNDVNDPNNGQVLTWIFESQATIGINEASPFANVSVYPNPAEEAMTVSGFFDVRPEHLTAIDAMGRRIALAANMGGKTITVDLTSLAAGHYVLEMSQGDQLLRRPFIKR